ncbi:MAG: hypothetical protein R3F13_22070 [Prosthecobacter sp.]
MTSGSIGPHRAFMGVCITACGCLMLVLFMGWQWYFDELHRRSVLIDLAAKAEAKARELESMGLVLDVPYSEPTPAPGISSAQASQPREVSATPAVTPGSSATSSAAVGRPRESKIRELSVDSSGDVVEALNHLNQYWETESWRDRRELVFDSARVSPLMEDYYETQAAADPIPGGLVSKARYEIDGTEILIFGYTSNRPTGSLEVAMRRGPDGRFLVDWESLVGYGEMSFVNFRSKRPAKPVLLRAYVRRFEYFNFEFSDSSKFFCVKVTSESGENSIYAYCERSTELGAWLESDLAATGPMGFKGYTMRVSFPDNAQSNQCVRLDEVVAPRWLVLP